MNTKQTKKTLREERQRLEAQQPELAGNYRDFLQSYDQYNRMKAQFEQPCGEDKTKPQTQFRTTR